MYLILDFQLTRPSPTIETLIRATAEETQAPLLSVQTRLDTLKLALDADHPDTQAFLDALERYLPASIFLQALHHTVSEIPPESSTPAPPPLPVNVAPCPRCQAEMFDPGSRRYFYPFTSCNACGAQHPFVEGYPYRRTNTLMHFFVPCDACKTETKNNPFRRDYPLIACTECGVPLRMRDGTKERIANDKGSYRQLFDVSARAIAKGKRVRFKTPFGYRLFFDPSLETVTPDTILLIHDANALNSHLMLVPEEFNALLSLERPLLRCATRSDEIQTLFGTTVRVKYADEGVTMLLAKALMDAGKSYSAYQPCTAETPADFTVDFDLPIRFQKETTLFINRDQRTMVAGERIAYPFWIEAPHHHAVYASGIGAVPMQEGMILDTAAHLVFPEHLPVRVCEGDAALSDLPGGSSTYPAWQGAMLSVLHDHGHLNDRAMGIHFEEVLSFGYYNGRRTIEPIPPTPFTTRGFWDRMRSFREGSDRLVEHFARAFPERYAQIDALEDGTDPFAVAAWLMGFDEGSIDRLSAESLSFMGKNGVQIDARLKASRFEYDPFLASIMSYILAGVDRPMLCYSLFESLGDHIAEVIPVLAKQAHTDLITLTGTSIANQALYGRLTRNLAAYTLLLPTTLPLDPAGSVLGALYLPE